MTDVRQSKPFGHEALDALAVQLAWRILERPTGLVGGEQDRSGLVDDDRKVPGLREDTFQVRGGGGASIESRSVS